MKLISLEMQNFRQHLDSHISFSDGLTGIIGTNGAGKSTVLEAMAWALYGAPAVRGTNDTIRSKASQGGAKVNVALTFELGGSIYKVARTLDGSGKSGNAVLEVDGKPLRSGMSEVTGSIAKLLGMDYQAFFTSFFTGQKQLEFMSSLEGRARAVAISRMLGYDRLTKARDQANEDRKGLNREIEGLERGLPDPEELKERRKASAEQLAVASKALEEVEKGYKASVETVETLKPQKALSDQRARRHDEISRRLELDRADVERMDSRLSQLTKEATDLKARQVELDGLKPDIDRYLKAGEEYKELQKLSKYESERQRLNGQISTLEDDLKRLNARSKQLADSDEKHLRAVAAVEQAELLLSEADKKIQALREERISKLHSVDAQVKGLRQQREEIELRKAQIAQQGPQGKCPTCERALADELPRVLANFDSQVAEIEQKIATFASERQAAEGMQFEINASEANRSTLNLQIEQLRKARQDADRLVMERNSIAKDIGNRTIQLTEFSAQLDQIPAGFDEARYLELQSVGEQLRPVWEKAVELKSMLKRAPDVQRESGDIASLLNAKKQQVDESDKALVELSFVREEHEALTRTFDEASYRLNDAAVQLERRRGDVNTARAVLMQIEREEDSLKTRLDELKTKRAERLYLETLAQAFDRFRADLNDRIRPELESIASELLSMMTDGRYNALEINDSYQAVIRDDGELKPVISGGEDDIVNLALRLAISQMIAQKAGQSFSLLVLDEVFGSLDDVRRNNVVSLLQNLKNRFEQIILITHVESIHDAVDNCVWVEFDEKTKTSRLTERTELMAPPEAGILQ